ncbi:MAG: MATE family efflux transporter, partial [Lachnospiraceae bacterium]|nr:MATE family efflux transporter [Lachnospiraceae bacterium]
NDEDVIAVGAVALRFQAATLPFLACVVISNMMLQSTGKGVKASITSSSRNGLFFIPLILVLPNISGLLGVEISQPIADVLSLFLAIPLAGSEIKKMG